MGRVIRGKRSAHHMGGGAGVGEGGTLCGGGCVGCVGRRAAVAAGTAGRSRRRERAVAPVGALEAGRGGRGAGRLCTALRLGRSLTRAVVLLFTGQRKGTPGIFSTHSRLRKEPVKMRMLDYAERNGFIKGVVTDIVHESGRGAPLAVTKFRNPYKYKMDKLRLIAAEGTYTGQFIYAGKKCEYTIPDALSIRCRQDRGRGCRGAGGRSGGVGDPIGMVGVGWIADG